MDHVARVAWLVNRFNPMRDAGKEPTRFVDPRRPAPTQEHQFRALGWPGAPSAGDIVRSMVARAKFSYKVDCSFRASEHEPIHARTASQYHKGTVKIGNQQSARLQQGAANGLFDDDDCSSEVSSDGEDYAAVA